MLSTRHHDRTRTPVLTTALDSREAARRLASVREAALAGDDPPDGLRTVIGESWRRVLGQGVDPDRDRRERPLSLAELEERRHHSQLAQLLPVLHARLLPCAEAAQQIMVVTDPEGRVLWREGPAAVRRMADRHGFEPGASWTEDVVGTNGIGTALVTRQPVLVHSAEHYVRSHHQWTCAGAPLHDPRDGRLLGVVDLSGPARSFHPTTLPLVSAVARLAECEQRTAHLAALDRLRASAAPLLARLGGRALAVDRDGWTAAATGTAPPDRVALPRCPQAGPLWLPRYGLCVLEPLPGGWLVRIGDDGPLDPAPSRVVLDFGCRTRRTVTVSGPAGSWSHELSPRHAEVLLVLALHPEGRTSAQLSLDLFGDAGRTTTVRAELSRLRRTLGCVLSHRPYRFADGIEVTLHRPPHPTDLLPHSTAPAVLTARGHAPRE
ncbi:diguanylate cyclase [Streptomyces sp. Ru73]|uniref:GAF domain-containing protein n=1 Tax=Streptomyces sp. Ru73 TaxID=2080748 RepID=UPI000CDDFE2B|nr:GAF domain-containing protein [Streptomyces sp. Ru73]POX37302.1 diguanylate cyclase [Streptomyces sp. Ru73]